MKKNIKLLSFASILIIGAVVVSTIASNDFVTNQSIKMNAAKSYELNLNKDKNKFHTTSGSSKVSGSANTVTECGNSISFTYNNIIGGGTSTWHVLSGDNGYFYNTKAIHGLDTISISSKTDNKSFKIYWSKSITFNDTHSQDFVTSTTVPTSFSFNLFSPNYFKLVNTSGGNINIESIKLNYSCEEKYSKVIINNYTTERGNVSGAGQYQVGDTVTLTASPNNGYGFVGWYKDSSFVSSNLSLTFEMGDNDVTYEAKFNIINYPITYELSGGKNNPNNPSSYMVEDDDIILLNPTKTHYTFINWTDQNDNIITTIESGSYGELTLTAHWELKNYQVIVSSEDTSKGLASGSGSYVYNSNVTVFATPKNGYEFYGWYNGEEKVSTLAEYSFTIVGDTSLIAKFTKKYLIYLSSEDESTGKVYGPTVAGAGLDVTVKAVGTINTSQKFNYSLDYWYNENFEEVSYSDIYSFIMPEHDVYLTALFKENDGIYYGEYPQSLVTDTNIINELDKISVTDSKGYKTYGHNKYLQYCGVSYYRDNHLGGHPLVTSGNHYYLVEPIKWKYLATEGSNVLVTTEYLIDTHRYNEDYKNARTRTDYYGNTSDGIYANNYKFSEIRTWLNTDFINQAFNDSSKLVTSEVDNSAKSTRDSSNSYVCGNTSDKVFLLSFKEITNTDYGFMSYGSPDPQRQCQTTEYARARDASYSYESDYWGIGSYYIRSPSAQFSHTADSVGIEGRMNSTYSEGSVGSYRSGVRPALRLSNL